MNQPYYHNGNRRRVETLTKQGLKPKQIAETLGLARSTVYTHQLQIRRREARKAQAREMRAEQ